MIAQARFMDQPELPALPQQIGALNARILAMEADISALTEDRKWMMRIVARLAVELEQQG